MLKRSILLLFVSLLFGVVHCQTPSESLRRLCNAQLSCRDCIIASPDCVWCADNSFNFTRCYANGDPEAGQCPSMEQNPTGNVAVTAAPPLENFVQVSPSRVEANVRPGTPQTFDLSVRPARDFPIDLYLLMDLSFSMRDDLENLRSLGSALAQAITTISSNFTIGFGSFVEKVAAPFVNLNPAVQNNPCLGRNDITCLPTYSYQHVISLTNDADEFDRQVQLQMISGNQDLPEGGFDGFLQSLLCTELIGWREVSRRIILYITDAGFHLAGDGKLAGVILPHPNTCNLPSSIPAGQSFVNYDMALTYDYPSIGQIAQALRDEDIIPIFAATASVRGFYDALVAEIGEGAFAGTLAADSRNVVELVENLYNTISQRVIFDQDPIPGVSVTVIPTNCEGGFVENGICNGLAIETTATFQASVSVTECTPALQQGPVTVPVRVVGFGTFEVILTAICQCPCEMNNIANETTICNGNGTLSCGQCICNPGNFGEFCQCDATNQQNNLICPVSPINNQQCSNRGTCVCGVCNCQTNFFGQACECDQSTCLNNGVLCSGRGTCGCDGTCMCNVETNSRLPYEGTFCECTPDTQGCRDPENDTSICNGRGMCGCDGTCECEVPEESGPFCQPQSQDDTVVCDMNINCARCALDTIEDFVDILTTAQFFTNNTLQDLPPGSTLGLDMENGVDLITLPDGHCSACPSGVAIVNETDSSYTIGGVDTTPCMIELSPCLYIFYVGRIDMETNNFTAVHLVYERSSCTQPQSSVAPWIIVISILIPLIVLGILLLVLLKLLLLLFDYFEVKRFERELAKTKYSKNENPLYRSATKDYQNPMYGH